MGIVFSNNLEIKSLEGNLDIGGILRSQPQTVPMFAVGKSNGGNGYVTAGTIIWNVVVFNDGNHFNASTGIFTAPIAGHYWFYVWIMTANNTSNVNRHYTLRRNNLTTSNNHNDVAYIYSSSTTSVHKQFSGGTIFKLEAGDNVRVVYGNGSLYMASIVYTRFSGVFLGN